jgi:hypothetical protein
MHEMSNTEVYDIEYTFKIYDYNLEGNGPDTPVFQKDVTIEIQESPEGKVAIFKNTFSFLKSTLTFLKTYPDKSDLMMSLESEGKVHYDFYLRNPKVDIVNLILRVEALEADRGNNAFN